METEIKLPVRNKSALQKAILAQGGTFAGKRTLVNEYFDFAGGRLQKNNEMLRLRNRELVTYKRRLGAREVRKCQEIEFAVSGGSNFREVMQKLGLRRTKTTRRVREEYSLGRARLSVDTTRVGRFLEIEADARTIHRTAKMLGYQRKDYILKTYSELKE